MEELVDEGLIKNIGVSNFGFQLIRELLTFARIKPANLQVELHPYMQQQKLVDYCHKQGITVTAYSSFGASSYVKMNVGVVEGDSILENEVIKGIAAELGKNPGQVALRWGIQRGTAVIPKSMNPERQATNLDLHSFQLTDDHMKAIAALEKGRRYNELSNYGLDLPIFDF